MSLFLFALLEFGLIVLLRRFWLAGVVLVLLAFLAGAIAVDPIGIELGSFNVYLEDMVCAPLVAAAVWRMLGRPLSRSQWIWILFMLFGLLAFVLGSQEYGVKPAGVEYRGFFRFPAAALYLGSFRLTEARLRQLFGVWMGFAAALLTLALFRWAELALGFASADSWDEVGGAQQIRVLNSAQALVVCQALIMAMAAVKWTANRARMTLFAVALFTGVILLQHRSVWVAMAVSAGFFAVSTGMVKRKAIWVAALLLAGTGYGAYHFLSRSTGDFAQSMQTSLEEPFDADNSTFLWRVALWQGYIGELADSGATGLATGTHFGNPTSYSVYGEDLQYSAHNLYVMVANRMGLIALALLIAGYIAAIAGARQAGTGVPHGVLLLALLMGQLTFYCVYGADYEQGLLLGVAVGYATAHARKVAAPVRRKPAFTRAVPRLLSSSGQPCESPS